MGYLQKLGKGNNEHLSRKSKKKICYSFFSKTGRVIVIPLLHANYRSDLGLGGDIKVGSWFVMKRPSLAFIAETMNMEGIEG